MPLNLGGGGDVRPYIRFKPSINAWEMSSEAGSVEFEWSSPAIIDVEHIQLGWLLLGEGVREWQAWPGNKQTARPDTEREWKAGFVVKVFSKALFGDEPVREFSSSQTGAVEFIKKLYNEAEGNFGKGQVPVVNITGAKAEKIGKGTTRIPLFEISKYVARPSALDGADDGSEDQAQSAPPKAAAAPKAKAETPEF
jgi:hypothetical protein